MGYVWDAETYSQQFQYVSAYGGGLLPLLELKPGERVLDLGCGNGRLTRAMVDLGVQSFGMDVSEVMLGAARSSYPDLPFFRADAADFAPEAPFDAILSNAVLHWIDREKQPAVLRCVYSALKDSGRFVFEMGGKGNNAAIHRALEKAFARRGLSYAVPFYFPSAEEYQSLLEEAGFSVSFLTLFDRPTRLEGEHGLADFIRMFLKKPFEQVPP